MYQLHLINQSRIGSDVIFTPEDVARDIVHFFKPSGFCLDPCLGDGAFYRYLPVGSEWCEISKGRDFFQWVRPVDWIISNPPYAVFSEWLRHSFSVAKEIVYLIPVNKPYNSYKTMVDIAKWGGIKHIYVIGPGSWLNFQIGFAIGAVHFSKGYQDGTSISFRCRLTSDSTTTELRCR